MCEKVPPARARGRNAPISSLHEIRQQKLTIITHRGTGLVDEEGGLFLDSQPIVGPNQAGLFLDAIVGPDQTEGQLFLVTVGGTRPRWAFLGHLCGTGPNQTQKKVGFSWTPLWNPTTPDRTRQNQSSRARRWAFLERPCGTRPRQTRPDQTKPNQTREKVGFS